MNSTNKKEVHQKLKKFWYQDLTAFEQKIIFYSTLITAITNLFNFVLAVVKFFKERTR